VRKKNQYIGFWVTQEQKDRIEENAAEAGLTVSAFLRDRALRKEVTNSEVVDLLMAFIAKKTLSSGKAQGDLGRKRRGSAPLDVQHMLETSGMSKEQKASFRASLKRVEDGAGKMVEELKTVLEARGGRVEQ